MDSTAHALEEGGVAVQTGGAVVLLMALRAPQVVDVMSHREGELVSDQPLAHQVQGHLVGHLPHCHPGLATGIGAGEHLAGTYTFGLRLVRLDVCHGHWLVAPGVVDYPEGAGVEFSCSGSSV